MPHSLRRQHANAFYLVMARGNRREDLFLDDDDRRFFIHTLGQACEMTCWCSVPLLDWTGDKLSELIQDQAHIQPVQQL
jgi:hypothetical protein